jgi:hypothetical protein
MMDAQRLTNSASAGLIGKSTLVERLGLLRRATDIHHSKVVQVLYRSRTDLRVICMSVSS